MCQGNIICILRKLSRQIGVFCKHNWTRVLGYAIAPLNEVITNSRSSGKRTISLVSIRATSGDSAIFASSSNSEITLYEDGSICAITSNFYFTRVIHPADIIVIPATELPTIICNCRQSDWILIQSSSVAFDGSFAIVSQVNTVAVLSKLSRQIGVFCKHNRTRVLGYAIAPLNEMITNSRSSGKLASILISKSTNAIHYTIFSNCSETKLLSYKGSLICAIFCYYNRARVV